MIYPAEKFVDLHLHLDGALTADMAKKLAERQHIKLPAANDEELERRLTVPENCRSLNDFLQCFELPGSLMQTAEGLSEAVRLVMEKAAGDGVIYAELRAAPQLHRKKGLSQEDAVRAMIAGLERAIIPGNLILCSMRGKGNETENAETLRLAEKYLVKDGGVTAFDLAGAEAIYPTADYRELFTEAKNKKVPFTIHAGEAGSAEDVRLAVEYGAKRIGHGVRMAGNENVLRMVRDAGIYLEMCPTSNLQTKAVQGIAEYPLMDFLNRGLLVTLNTDDPGIEGTTLKREYRLMEKHFDLTENQERVLIQNAINGAFASDDRKRALRMMMENP